MNREQWHVSKWFLFPSPCLEHEKIFLQCFWRQISRYFTLHPRPLLGPPADFNCQTCPRWGSSNLLIWFRFSYTSGVSWSHLSCEPLLCKLWLPIFPDSLFLVVLFCPVSFLSRIQEEMVDFQSVQFFPHC